MSTESVRVVSEFREFARDQVERATARIAQGSADYADTSFALSSHRLTDEILDELADVCGWSFILASRLQRLQPQLERIERLLMFVDQVRLAVPADNSSFIPLRSHDDHVIAVRRVQQAIRELDDDAQ